MNSTRLIGAVLVLVAGSGTGAGEPQASVPAATDFQPVGSPQARATEQTHGSGKAPDAGAKVRGGAEDLLLAIPGDASVVLAVRDLAGLDAKLKNLAQQLGMLPVSLYQLAKGQLEIVTGIEDRGSAALILVPSMEPGSIARSLPMLLPANDPEEMLTFLNPQPPTDGYTKVTLRGRDSYVGVRGPFAVFGAERATVQRVVDAPRSLRERFSPHQRQRFMDNDVLIWIDTASLGSSPLSEFPPARFVGSLQAAGGWEKRYRSVQASLRVEPDGLAVEFYAERFDGHRPSSKPGSSDCLLRGLSREPFVLAMGLGDDTSSDQASFVGRLVVSAGVAFGVLTTERAAELSAWVDQIAEKIGDVSSSFVSLPEGPDGLIGVTKVIRARGGPVGAQGLLAEVESLVRLLKSGIFLDPRVNRAMEELQFRRGVETSLGVTIDHLTLDLSGFDVVDQATLLDVFGRDGLLLRLGVVDGKYVVATFGGGRPRFDAAVTAVRAGRAPLCADPGIVTSGQRIATRRWGEGYVAADRLVELMDRVGRAWGIPSRLPSLPELSAPAAWVIHPAGSGGVQIDLFLPIDLVVALKDAALSSALGGVSRVNDDPGP